MHFSFHVVSSNAGKQQLMLSSHLQMKLHDTPGAQQCLKGKRVIMLGDSTLTETMHDLVLLLSGLGSQPADMAAYLYNATR